MNGQDKGSEEATCPRCKGRGTLRQPTRAGPRVLMPLPGAPSKPYSVNVEFVFDGIRRVVEGKVKGECGDEVAVIVSAMLEGAARGGMHLSLPKSTIGILNPGEIEDVHSIAVHVSTLAETGLGETAEALKNLTEAVAANAEIGSAERAVLLDQLEELSTQATLPAEERARPGVIKAILTGLAAGLGAAGGLAEVWSTWGHLIRQFFAL